MTSAKNKEDRKKTLESLSGMEVRLRDEKNQTVYEFRRLGIKKDVVTAFFSYPKAKAFAEGVNFGRTYGFCLGN